MADKKQNSRDEALTKAAKAIWSPLLDFVQLNTGFFDASAATKPVRVGKRVIPNKVHVEFGGDGYQPSLTLELEVIDGVPQCRKLTITSVENGREVKPLDLKAVSLDAWVADAFAAFAFETDDVTMQRVTGGPAGRKLDVAAANEFQNARRGKGARKVTPEVMQNAAAIYSENYKRGGGALAVASHFGVSERTAQGYVKAARDAGYLSPTTRGKKGI